MILRLLILLTALMLAGGANAWAYVDPGMAGILYQFGYAAVVAVIGWFAGLRYVFYRFFSRRQDADSSE